MRQISKNIVAAGAAIVLAACGWSVFAQDDLDDLLADLEAESTAAVEATAPAEEQPAAEVAVPAAATEVEAEVAETAPAVEEPAPAEEPTVEEPAPVEEPAVEEPVTEEPAPVVDEPVAEEPVAEEPAPAVEEPAAEEPVAEEPVAEEPVAEEPAAEEPATVEEPVVEEPVAEEPAPAVEEAVAEEEETVPAAEEPAPAVEEPAAEEPAPAEEPAAEEPAPATRESDAAEEPKATKALGPDAELIENIRQAERVRRTAYDIQALREIENARAAMRNGDYIAAVKYYANAKKLLNDSAANAGHRNECDQGIAEGLYRAATQEYSVGRRDRAKKLMGKAVDMRHPKARRQLEVWNSEEDPDANKTDVSEVNSRRNLEDYKDQRAKNLQHLKRSRQLLGTRELDRALDECELVLVNDPYNQAALRLRDIIQKKRHTILLEERKAARDGMMADVDKAWRPVYAVDAREIEQAKSTTIKTNLSGDPTLALEQTIIKRMKDMRLPSISFKPPATIIDAVEFFRGASRDYDRPDIPMEQRGFNFVLKTPETLRASAAPAQEESDGFGGGDEEEGGSAQAGVPVIPMITASDITFFEALKLVCESVDYKFKVQGPIVMVMQKDMSTDEMVTRSYPVVSAFMERMGSASSDMKEMKSAGFGGGARKEDDGEENQERDWKEFFSLLGVNWPEGSSIMYIKTIGKLRVRNTYENLAELEKALTEMNADPKLIEIEARFVEVCQEDLNSLGFEWILNSDYSIGLGKHVSRALGVRRGAWGTSSGSTTYSTSETTGTSSSGSTGGVIHPGSGSVSTLERTTTVSSESSKTFKDNTSGASWIRNSGGGRSGNMGVNAIGGKDSAYSTNMRYLSTDSNHISGESNSNPDAFMRVNAFLGSADLSMILHMLSQRSDTDLLSAPKVLTKPGEEAVIKVVTEYIYPTDYDVQLQSSSSSSGSNSGGSQSAILAVVEPQSFTMREVGVILDVTPTLTDDGNLIDLKLNTQVVDEPTWKNYGMRIPFTGNSSLQSFEGIGDILTGLSEVLTSLGTGLSDTVKAAFAESTVNAADSALASLTQSSSENITYYDAPMEQPFFHVRSIDSSVSVFPGATIVMGGLITEQRKAMDDKIPFLGDLPLIGRLFRSHSEMTSKRNLLIFVTTRLVDVRGREVAMGESDEKTDEATPVDADGE